jgi:hypothetical protein
MNPTEFYKQPKLQAIRARLQPLNKNYSCLQRLFFLGCTIVLIGITVLIPDPYKGTYLSVLYGLAFIAFIFYRLKAFSFMYSKIPIQLQNDFQELMIEGKEPIKIKEAERITFLYLGDVGEHRFFRQTLVRRISTDASHNRFFVDHLKINHDEIFFQIKTQEDKVNYFNFINQMHYFNPKTKLIVGRDEIPLPVDPNQVFLVNENRQLLK